MRAHRLVRPVLLAVAVVLAGTLLAPAGAATTTATPWLCRPGLANDPCEIPLDTTYLRADGTSTVSTPARQPAGKRPVDCFYVYPTVSNQLTPTATATAEPENVSIAKYQAARFSTQCRVFAPLYRQTTFVGIVTRTLLPSEMSYQDVRAAWKEYLAKDNRGRGFVLVGHSQGTLMLRRLIRDEIDKNPAVRKRFVGGVLMGGNVKVAKGRTTGGDFTNVPTCTRKGQAGCVVAYSTYSTDPLPISFFGNADVDLASRSFGLPPAPGQQVACTDPGPLSGIASPVGVTVPSEQFAPGPINLGILYSTMLSVPTAATTWVSPADRFRGACRTINGVTIYRYDPVGAGSRRPLEFPPTWGTHLFDVNLGLERLVKVVELQSAAWRRANA